MAPAPINHICLDERGIAYIAGTRMKVRHIAIEKRAWGLTPEQIQAGYAHLTMAQVYAALSYYYDHKAEMDAEIERVDREVEEMRAQNPNPMTRKDFEERLEQRQRDAGAFVLQC